MSKTWFAVAFLTYGGNAMVVVGAVLTFRPYEVNPRGLIFVVAGFAIMLMAVITAIRQHSDAVIEQLKSMSIEKPAPVASQRPEPPPYPYGEQPKR